MIFARGVWHADHRARLISNHPWMSKRVCLFCEGTPVSQEHAIAEWVGEVLPTPHPVDHPRANAELRNRSPAGAEVLVCQPPSIADDPQQRHFGSPLSGRVVGCFDARRFVNGFAVGVEPNFPVVIPDRGRTPARRRESGPPAVHASG